MYATRKCLISKIKKCKNQNLISDSKNMLNEPASMKRFLNLKRSKDENCLLAYKKAKNNYHEVGDSNSLDEEDQPKPIVSFSITEKHLKCNKVMFGSVIKYYFGRKQNKMTIPSEGGSSLGMERKHFNKKQMTVDAHQRKTIKFRSKSQSRASRLKNFGSKIKQLRREKPDMNNYKYVQIAMKKYPDLIPSFSSASSSSDSEDDRSQTSRNLQKYGECHRLDTIAPKKRRLILRLSGVCKIDSNEKLKNQCLRESREKCGCDCSGICYPETCSCYQMGIPCQVDRDTFPCGCANHGCHNSMGKIQFDTQRVKTHYDQVLHRKNDTKDGYDIEFSESAYHTPYVTMCDVTPPASFDDKNVPSTVITCTNSRPRRKRIIKFSESPVLEDCDSDAEGKAT